MVQKLYDACGEEFHTKIVSVAYLVPETCFSYSTALTYQLIYQKSIIDNARDVYCLKVRPAQWALNNYWV